LRVRKTAGKNTHRKNTHRDFNGLVNQSLLRCVTRAHLGIDPARFRFLDRGGGVVARGERLHFHDASAHGLAVGARFFGEHAGFQAVLVAQRCAAPAAGGIEVKFRHHGFGIIGIEVKK